MVASGCLMYVFGIPLLNNLIKKAVCIVSMQRLAILSFFQEKNEQRNLPIFSNYSKHNIDNSAKYVDTMAIQ